MAGRMHMYAYTYTSGMPVSGMCVYAPPEYWHGYGGIHFGIATPSSTTTFRIGLPIQCDKPMLQGVMGVSHINALL